MTAYAFRLPIRIVSVANAREHWSAKAKRAKDHRFTAYMATRAWLRGRKLPRPIEVTLTRLAPRKLDGDNLQSAFKALRDGVADALAIDDGSAEATWLYEQRVGKPREYAAIVTIQPRGTT